MADPLPKDSPTAFAVRVLGIVPHQAQATFLECRARIRVAACGRRFGKTTMGGISILHFAITQPGTVQMLIAPTADQSRILWRTARDMAEGCILSDLITHQVDSPFPEFRLAVRDAGGQEVESIVMARSVSHDARYVRGHGADRVVADEAAFLPPPVLSQVIPPVLAASPYGSMDLYSTPFGTSGPYFELFRQGERGESDIRSFHFPTSANPRVSRSYLDAQRLQMTELAYRTEYEADFLDDQASVFRSHAIQAAIDHDLSEIPLEGHRYVIGYDPARYADRSGVAVVDVTDVPYQAVHVQDIGGRDYLLQASIIARLSETYNRATVVLDATSHDQMAEELRQRGIHVEPVRFTNEVKQGLIDGLVLALERRDLRIPPHADLIKELTYYRFETTPAGHVKLGAPDGPGHFDDLVTALALAVHEARSGPDLPFAWLRNDPEFRARVLGTPETHNERSAQDHAETDDERIARRRAAYYAALEGRGGD